MSKLRVLDEVEELLLKCRTMLLGQIVQSLAILVRYCCRQTRTQHSPQ